MQILGRKVPIWFSLPLWMVLWEVVGRTGAIFLIPPFTDVIAAAVDELGKGSFHEAVSSSLEALFIGVGAALLVGIPLGVLMARVRAVDRVMSMWVNIFVSAPLTAVVPMLMAVIGIGQNTVIVTVFLFAVWVITLDTQAGMRQVSPALQEMAQSFGATRLQLYTRVLVWAALPEILAGIRLGLIRGVRGVVVGQLIVSVLGLGAIFELYSRNFLMDHFWAVILYVFGFAFLLSEGVAYIERRVEYYAMSR